MPEKYQIAIFLFVLIAILVQVQKRLRFSQGVNFKSTTLIRYKNYKPYSLFGIIIGTLILIYELLKFNRSHSSEDMYLGIINGLLLITGSLFKPSNYIAVSDSGIDIDNDHYQWKDIEKITKNEFSYIVTAKNTNYFIDFSELNSKEEFLDMLREALNKYRKTEILKLT